DMSDDKGSLDCLPIYSFLFPNKKGSNLYNAYDRSEVKDKLVIKIDQDAVINIDALEKDIEITVIATSSDSSKCDYHILYASILLIDHHKLKAFTELVYIITGEKFSKYIDRELPDQNFNLRLISSAKKGCVKRILLYLINNEWNELDHTRVEPPVSLYFEGPKVLSFPKAFVNFPSWVKYNDFLTATEIYEKRYIKQLPNRGDIYVGSPWKMGKTYILENLAISDNINLLVLSTRHSYSNAVITRLNLKSYCNIDVSIIAQVQSYLAKQSIEKLYKLIQDARRIIVMDNDLMDLNIEWIKILRKNIQYLSPLFIILTSLRKTSLLPFENRKSTEFPELRIKEYHSKSDPMEKAQDFSNVKESWKDINLVAYTSTLKIGISCINPKFERAFCIFNKKGLFQWLLNAKRECLTCELQNRGIFPNVDSIIWNKDVLTIRLWAGIVVFVMEFIPKPEDTMILLFQTVKTAELLENKPMKILEEMCSLDRYHIVDYYGVPPELLTKDFISKYGNYNHMKWFRAYKQLRDA
ncbi:11825_t:CDS:10, partial [Funneliformis geosporum]